jgi:hypothetical protein
MDAAHTSLDLIAHFDDAVRPHTARDLPMRGVGWVLQWAAACAVLFFAASVLIEFGYCLSAEQALARSARAGVLEATLPRATHQSVASIIDRRLVDYPTLSNRLRFSFHHNGVPVTAALDPRDGDRLTVILAAPTDAALPQWLRAMKFWRRDGQIEVRAERQMPGRQLRTSPVR